MIPANELMLGNWVHYKMDDDVISKHVKVELISNQCVDVTNGENSWDVDECDLIGIPITDELLEKCVFDMETWIDSNNVIVNRFRDGYAILIYGKRIEDISFLHELQNAYFMLTKKHLAVKL